MSKRYDLATVIMKCIEEYRLDLNEEAIRLSEDGYDLKLHFVDDGYHCFLFQKELEDD